MEAAQEFWDQHSTADYEDEMEEVEMELSPALKSKLELRKLYRILGFSPDDVAKIEARAERERVSSKRLMSRWILEHV